MNKLNFENFDFPSFDDLKLEKKQKFKKSLLIKPKEKRILFNLKKAEATLNYILDDLPSENTVYKMFSPAGGWSSCALVMWFASKVHIENLKITTLRVGKRELQALIKLKKDKRISNIEILLAGVPNKKEEDTLFFEDNCAKHDIKFNYVKNHSKVILIDTNKGKFVIETSSNFNENPQVEQFSIENSADVYKFYSDMLEIIKNDYARMRDVK